MLKIFAFMFVFFICFMTVAITVAKAYRVKNDVISILERTSVVEFLSINGNSSNTSNGNFNDVIKDYLDRTTALDSNTQVKFANDCNTKIAANKNNGTISDDTLSGPISGEKGGTVCLIRVNDGDEFYFQVYSYVNITFPIFDFNLTIPIKGETKVFIH